MGVVERAIRVATYVAAFVGVFAWSQTGLSAWALPWTRPGSPRRMRRANLLYQQWGSSLFWLTVHVLDSRLAVRGVVPAGRFVIVSNHQSTADIAILIANLRPLNCKFVAKRTLGRWIPAVSTALARAGSALIARTPTRADLRALQRMGRELATWNASAIVFAESSRSRDGHLRPYKSAAVRLLARESGLPLLPVAIDGTWAAADLDGFVTGMPGLRVSLTIGEPVPPETWSSNFDATLDAIRAWTAAAIETSRQDGLTALPPGWRPGATLADEA